MNAGSSKALGSDPFQRGVYEDVWASRSVRQMGGIYRAALSCVALSSGAAFGRESDDDQGDDEGKVPLTVTKAVCGPRITPRPHCRPSAGVPCGRPASRALTATQSSLARAGATERTGSRPNSRTEWAHTCATTAPHSHCQSDTPGCATIDLTNADHPTPAGYLTSISMLDPWESLKVNAQRQLLAADKPTTAQAAPRSTYTICRRLRSRSTSVGRGRHGHRWRRYRACDWPRGQLGTGRVNVLRRQSRSTSLLRSRYGGSNRAKIDHGMAHTIPTRCRGIQRGVARSVDQ